MTAPSPHYSPLPGDDPNEIVKAFAANRAFRAAEWEELTTEDNPYRRPVRPDDLAWLDYSGPMPADKALKLSGLLGHRMLRNVYDLDALHLPPARTPAVAADQKAFYSHDNRVLSALAKPVLEHHLFSFLAEGRTPLERPGVAAATSHVVGAFEQRGAAGNRAIDAVERTVGKREAGTFLMLQLSAFLPAMNAAVGRAALGEYDLACDTLRPFLVDEYRSWVNSSAAYTKMLEGGGLKTPAAAYWQLYLTTSLARGNHLHHLSVNRENLFAFLGALVHKKMDESLTRERFADAFATCLTADTGYFDTTPALTEDGLRELVGRLLTPLVARYGDEVVEGFHQGFEDAARFAALWETDMVEQVTWADNIQEYQDKAIRIDKYLSDNNIVVDLDTFVESNEETSTTHVHNEHRLVMIESGQMHFWNNVTHKIEFNQGDKVLIPVSRLHGSTVLSGECTYHQPIIPDDMLNQIF
ncbi:peptide synthetase [Streptomyces anulatus]|uniref:Peptide synthetase n=1 Tax=Streptomyces anulatus TaxID=1892 RepID=A0A7K3RFV4_STRAQ|nr:peptide synthetase [Streptomyces anulatus]NEC01035.1 peptide synthetase [Streptomyces anulatus]NED28157.1 peptide synthetase [Streptomyces anulatus]